MPPSALSKSPSSLGSASDSSTECVTKSAPKIGPIPTLISRSQVDALYLLLEGKWYPTYLTYYFLVDVMSYHCICLSCHQWSKAVGGAIYINGGIITGRYPATFNSVL